MRREPTRRDRVPQDRVREGGVPTATGTDQWGGDVPIGDAELAALALTADPDLPLGADAIPLDVFLGSSTGHQPEAAGPLPEWYMPPVMARRARRGRRVVIVAIVGVFLAIEAAGLCSTFGQLPFH